MERNRLIGPRIKAISTAMGQVVNRSTAELGLTSSQSFFIGYLMRHRDRPVYPRDLEREFEFSHPTVSGILRRLESKGFVTFQPGENDRRCKQVLLTEKAVECHEAILRRLNQSEQDAIRGLSEAEVAELHRLLDIIMKNMGVTRCCPPGGQEDEL